MWQCSLPQRFKPVTHLTTCADCQAHTQQSELTEQMLAVRAAVVNRQPHAPTPEFMQKLAVRLRLESEPCLATLMTWEMAVLSLRGWVMSFGAVALLLIALATTLAFKPAAREEGVFTANAVDSTPQNAFWLGE